MPVRRIARVVWDLVCTLAFAWGVIACVISAWWAGWWPNLLWVAIPLPLTFVCAASFIRSWDALREPTVGQLGPDTDERA